MMHSHSPRLPDCPFATIIRDFVNALLSLLFAIKITGHFQDAVVLHTSIPPFTSGNRCTPKGVVVGVLFKVCRAIAASLRIVAHEPGSDVFDEVPKCWKGDTDNHKVGFDLTD